MIELTEEQQRELTQPEPIAIDPRTQEEYVLVRRAVYERLRVFLDETVLATGELVDRVMAEDDGNDPTLESYQSPESGAGTSLTGRIRRKLLGISRQALIRRTSVARTSPPGSPHCPTPAAGAPPPATPPAGSRRAGTSPAGRPPR
jgi:hypothetical protein